jgi:CRISPR-associated protein Cas2
MSDVTRILKAIDFGFRSQYSIFLCRLPAADFVRLKIRLYDIFNLEED